MDMNTPARPQPQPRQGAWIFLSLFVTILCASAPAAVAAAGDSGRPPQSVSSRISVANIDLAKPEGARIVRQRITAEARRLCATFRDTRTVAHRETFLECVHDAVTDAQRQIDAPLLAQRNEPEKR